MTAEQLYQQQVHNWLVQNGAPNAGNDNQGNAPPQENAGWGQWAAPPAHPLPTLPEHLVNYHAWLAAQGLTFQHGVVPEDNISDNPMEAWNDTFSSSDDSSAPSDHALLVFPNTEPAPLATQDTLNITVNMHNNGIQFGLSTNGSELLNLLLSDPIPRQRLNNFIFHALRPALATIGPWSSGYGMESANVQVTVLVSSDVNGIALSQLLDPPRSSVVLEDISEDPTQNNQLLLPAPDAPLHSEPTPLAASHNVPLNSELDSSNERALQGLPTPVINSSAEPAGLATVNSIMAPASPSVVTRGRRARAPAPISTVEVRRSNRSNKYNGFKVNQVIETRTATSKVKPRLVPSIGSSSSAMEPNSEVVPHTPVHVLQSIGINRCAVPAAELTEDILTAAPAPSSAASTPPGSTANVDLPDEAGPSRA